jgi:hypothetical protein
MNTPATTNETKRCRRCLLHLPLDKFYPDPSTKSGLSTTCLKCKRMELKEHRERRNKPPD